MAALGTRGHPRPPVLPVCHVTVMAALMAVVSLGTLVQCDKKEVPASPSSSFSFDDVDADGNGCVEGPEELQNFRLQVGKILGEALQLGNVERALRAGRITHSADINGDGRICQCDLLSILVTESTGPGAHRHAFRVYEDGSFFDDLDTDDDGVLGDVTELDALTQKLTKCVPLEQAKAVVNAMSRLDKDDGKLAKAEYMLFLQSSPRQKQSASLPQPVPQPQGSPQQPQGAPQQRQPANGDQGRPRKRLLPPQFRPGSAPGRPLQPVSRPAQPWRHPQRHFLPMDGAGPALKAAGQTGNPGDRTLGAMDHPQLSLRSSELRHQPAVPGTRPSHAPGEEGGSQGVPRFPVGLQAQHDPRRLEEFDPHHPGPHPRVTQHTQHQPAAVDLPTSRPTPQPETRMLPGRSDPGSQTRPSEEEGEEEGGEGSETVQPKPEAEKADEVMQNLSDQLTEVKSSHPGHPQPQSVGENLETQLQKKERN
ncbi:uncharacterized protein LOC143276013 [Babylonia areolata]|uniref:uncharacterized protein LOC143276013 n=1 Tax=Babylonia areolata TaxID=304850 RepID=UPI003FD0927E